MKLIVINGPNLNMLGKRESSLYGSLSLDELNEFIEQSKKNTTEIDFFQSNSESLLIEKIHSLESQNLDGIIINAGAFTHTSVALRDALLIAKTPFIEVHISNVYTREDFRKKSFLADVAQGVVTGLGKYSYLAALNYFENR